MKNLTDKEMTSFAPQLQKYDMDGYVGMVISDNGILRKRKAFFLYYMKLKGNMLFYFKVTLEKIQSIKLTVCESECQRIILYLIGVVVHHGLYVTLARRRRRCLGYVVEIGVLLG